MLSLFLPDDSFEPREVPVSTPKGEVETASETVEPTPSREDPTASGTAGAAPSGQGRWRWLAKLGLFWAGFAMGVLFVCLYFGLIYTFFYRLIVAGMAGKTALVLLAVLGVLGIPLFFVLARLVRRMDAGRYAFPLGAFLTADAALLSVPLFDLMAPAKLMYYAKGSKELAQTYAYSLVVMITALVFLVLCWLISVLFVAFRYFQSFGPMTDPKR